MSKKEELFTTGERSKVVKPHDRVEHRDIRGKRLPYAVELVKKCVDFYRNAKRPIKNVYLAPLLYEQVKDWTRRVGGERVGDLLEGDQQREGVLTYDGVFIREASSLAIEPITWDFYPELNRGNA